MSRRTKSSDEAMSGNDADVPDAADVTVSVDTRESDSSAPDAAGPDTRGPDTSEPDTTGPDTTESALVRFQARPKSVDWVEHVTSALDLSSVAAATVAFLVAIDVDFVFQRWFALYFVLFGPGWAIVRWFGRRAGVAEIFLGIGMSLAVAAAAGHVAVTVLRWHWALPAGLIALATATAILIARRQDVARAAYRASLDRLRPTPVKAADAVPHPGVLPPSSVLAVGGIGLFAAVVAGAGLLAGDESRIGRLGLIDAVPAVSWAGISVLLVCAVLVVGEQRRHKLAFGVLFAAVLFLLHGSSGLLETHPRFPVAWLHTGFIDTIAEDGILLGRYDARFSWPGFFAGGAYLQQLTGTDSTMWLVRFAPVFINATAALGIWALGRSLRLGVVPRSLAILLFVVVNWTGQDYFSPQATAFVLVLTVLVLVSDYFPDVGPAVASRAGRTLRYRGARTGPNPEQSSRLLFLCLALCGVIVVVHQLSPVFLVAMLIGLALAQLITARWLGVTVALMTLAWLSFGSEIFWIFQLEKIVGDVGAVDEIVGANVGNRVTGALPSRELLLQARLGLTGVVWLAAAAAGFVSWRRGLGRRQLFLLTAMVAPFPALVAQPYGGELLIRIYLFTLPFAVLLIADAWLHEREPSETSLLRRLQIGLVLVLVVPVFMLARFGNAEYESVSDPDIATYEALITAAPTGAEVFVDNRQTLIDWQRAGDFRFTSLDSVVLEPLDGVAPADELSIIGDAVLERLEQSSASSVFVYFTRSQQTYGEQTGRFGVGYLSDLVDELLETDRFLVVQRVGAGAVLEFVG